MATVNEKMTALADAVRGKTGDTDKLTLDEMTSAITNYTTDATAAAAQIFIDETAYVNGNKITGTFTIDDELTTQDDLISQITTALEGKAAGSEDEDALITGELIAYTNNKITSIRGYAFAYCSSLTSVNFPAVTTIGVDAFMNCISLTSVNFPVVTTMSNFIFSGCKNLTTVNFPKVASVGRGAFVDCSSLISVNFPVATTIREMAFMNCTGLTSVTSVNFPLVTIIESNAFNSCSNLNFVSLPTVTTIERAAFIDCISLTSVNFPLVTTIGSSAFQRCTGLTEANFPNVTSIRSKAFFSCTALTTITLNASQICTLAASNAFSGTGIWSNKGSIFVPASLVSAYKTATNWVFFAARIFAAP